MAKDKKPSNGIAQGIGVGTIVTGIAVAASPFTGGLSLLFAGSLGLGAGMLTQEVCSKRPEKPWEIEITEIDGKKIK